MHSHVQNFVANITSHLHQFRNRCEFASEYCTSDFAIQLLEYSVENTGKPGHNSN